MPREKEDYRANLERIVERFPGKELLNIKEVMDFTGLSRNAVRKYFSFNAPAKTTSVATLAREMCGK